MNMQADVDAQPLDILSTLQQTGEREGFSEQLGDDHGAMYCKGGKTLFVSFDTLAGIENDGAEGLPWGYSFSKRNLWSYLSVISDGETGFRAQEVDAFFERLARKRFFKKPRQVIFYGAGLAGHAAATFARHAPKATVLLLSPVATLSRKEAPWETRYRALWRKAYDGLYGYAPDGLEKAKSVYVISDPTSGVSAMQASLFRGPNITKLSSPNLGDKIESYAQQLDVLEEFVLKAAEGTLSQQLITRRFRLRRHMRGYQKDIVRRLEEAGRFRWLELYCDAILQREPGPFFRQARARALQAQGK